MNRTQFCFNPTRPSNRRNVFHADSSKVSEILGERAHKAVVYVSFLTQFVFFNLSHQNASPFLQKQKMSPHSFGG